MTYEELPDDIKSTYTKEQCEMLIAAAEKLTGFFDDLIELIRKLIRILQPAIKATAGECQDMMSALGKELEELEFESEYRRSATHSFLPYKPKIKQMAVYKRPIYYHIRSNLRS